VSPGCDWPFTPATAFWILLTDLGAFVMERRMLLGIRKRAERASTTESDRGRPGIVAHRDGPPATRSL
jgi:hypothetical protein